MIAPLTPLPPNHCLGILGGGQLARMIVMAAARFGYRSLIWDPDPHAPAGQISRLLSKPYDDPDALDEFCSEVQRATVEFENVPLDLLETLRERRVMIAPHPNVWRICAHRAREKTFINHLGAPTPAWRPVKSTAMLPSVLEQLGEKPCIVKRSTGGYDGKQQVRLNGPSDLLQPTTTTALESLFEKTDVNDDAPVIVEEFIEFDIEVAVLMARSHDGTVDGYTPVRNIHTEGILRQTLVPATLSNIARERLLTIAVNLIEELSVCGLLCVEAFIRNDDVWINELAPRPHNSGHWTLDGSLDSQFDILVRVLAGLPMPEFERFANATMINILGNEIDQWHDLIRAGQNHRVHLYGKSEIKPRRKMGHVTILSAKSERNEYDGAEQESPEALLGISQKDPPPDPMASQHPTPDTSNKT